MVTDTEEVTKVVVTVMRLVYRDDRERFSPTGLKVRMGRDISLDSARVAIRDLSRTGVLTPSSKDEEVYFVNEQFFDGG